MSQLNIVDRANIFLGIQKGFSDAVIARCIGKHRSTVWREIKAGGGRDSYEPFAAQALRDKRQARAVKKRMLFGGGVPFNSSLQMSGKFAGGFSHLHYNPYEKHQNHFNRTTETWRHRPSSGKIGSSYYFFGHTDAPHTGTNSETVATHSKTGKQNGARKAIRTIKYVLAPAKTRTIILSDKKTTGKIRLSHTVYAQIPSGYTLRNAG
ncbi:hypothetical protein FUAX_13460 [Fulvitalea axinellae]|uniref:Transposase IS30-like HTH domain-containing protein n=1 Tax=Fulvitalea axinellae TaxID=1182444 RepID=A0AAU9D3D2_9BACT|nr:hypothetical protein FUAX_13460 [Fulvitalea axinellae]